MKEVAGICVLLAQINNYDVQVFSKSSGNPVKHAKVALGFSSLLGGVVTSGQYTDSNGEAHFDVKPQQGKVFVNGATKKEGHLSGHVVVYV
jgi:uncharacterized protein YfaS (alpha-2-macroglobulin family)